jgi:hypothetical protein
MFCAAKGECWNDAPDGIIDYMAEQIHDKPATCIISVTIVLFLLHSFICFINFPFILIFAK